VNKRIAWWMSFSFLLGILACCVSAFVSANRFGFALEGAWCAVDRIYYDSLYGQLKTSEPKWEGMENVTTISNSLAEFYDFITVGLFDWTTFIGTWSFDYTTDNYYWKPTVTIVEGNYDLQTTRFNIIINSLARLRKFKPDPTEGKTRLNELLSNDFTKIKSTFLDDHFYYYTKTLKACLKILAMVYYSFLLTAITAAGVSMMFYACLKRQGYLLTFMHVLWNVIRFFMFSFFLYGTAYGIGFLAIRDSIAYLMYVFGDNLLDESDTKLINDGKPFFQFCLRNDDSNIKNKFDQIYTTSLSDFFYNYYEIINNNTDYGNIQANLKYINDTYANGDASKNSTFFSLVNRAGKEGGLFGSFDCGFLKSNLNLLYTALYDASVESRILCAVSLCSAFFGAVAVYFFLLVMHHYNNELFFDTGKSIFTGFDGFGGGFKKKNNNQDPAFKKRKLRAEIELTSKNEDNDVKNNEEEED
jgi:hypothetical protein